ncbi:TraR/DksA C4-type zinc finger protein [Patescibacteria group bacterium]|nr:TraR/DksA C4-type zinc finger protein [Patescibacteria group bacterium]
MTTNTAHFKDLLLKECEVLENELKTVGRKNPNQKGDWEAVEGEAENDAAEVGDIAGSIEQYETNSSILIQLEKQLADVKSALEKIKSGTYGICEVCHKEIEEDRLEANPSSQTCKEHMN